HTSRALYAATCEAITAAMDEARLLDYRVENSLEDEDGTVLSPYASLTYDTQLEFKLEDVEDGEEDDWTVINLSTNETVSDVVYGTKAKTLGTTNEDGESLYDWNITMYTLTQTTTTDSVTKEIGSATYKMTQWYQWYIKLSNTAVTWTKVGAVTVGTSSTATIAETSAYYVNRITPYEWTQSAFTANADENGTAETVTYERVVDATVYAKNYPYSEEELPVEASGEDYWKQATSGYYQLYVVGVSAEDIADYLYETYGLIYTTTKANTSSTTWTLGE
ncbi:MAG: hypothetical protein LIO42_00880, partial [Oscillospiraceae bacterium]|nr:hypothetical protein [Oscillospiraceae bacterium]